MTMAIYAYQVSFNFTTWGARGAVAITMMLMIRGGDLAAQPAAVGIGMNNLTVYRLKHQVRKFDSASFLFCFSVFNLLPVLWMCLSSLKTEQDYQVNILSFPKALEFGNYYEVRSWRRNCTNTCSIP